MHVLITGAAGMLGRKLSAAIARGGLPATRLTLADQLDPPAPAGIPVRKIVVPLTDRQAPQLLLADRPAVIFHLAAVVSAEAEAEFEKGYAVNLDATRALLDAIRRMSGYAPRLVFASSLAVFGPPFPDLVPDEFAPNPASSYGIQKLMAEALVNDHSRRGHLDGISLRLPTLCIRPGAANRAASGFFSAILREPLAGHPANLPVAESFRHYFASPRSAVDALLRAARLDTAALGQNRALVLPGLSATVHDLLEALRDRQGARALALISRNPDPAITAIVESWPGAYAATRARALGFTAETRASQLIDAYLEEDAPFLRR
jgi:nucleoside-diphosphate-sugar epimerase